MRKKENSINRVKTLTFNLNKKEMDLVELYIKKYKIDNRSRWVRETLLAHIVKTLEYDYPTLFCENEMRR